MIRDEITKIEEEGIRKTQIGDWSVAREYFEEALLHDMPALRQAKILRNIAGTYLKEGNREGVILTTEKAIAVLDSENISAPNLRNELKNLSTFSGSGLPLSTFWYGVVFIAGIYWGLSFVSGAPMDAKLVFLSPPFICLANSCFALRGLNSRSLIGALTLYVDFLFSFGIGYMIAESGIIRFNY